MAGIDKRTGKVLTDNFVHTLQSMEEIFTTRFGERVERRHVGSIIPHLLGENLTPATWLRFLASIPASLAVIELNGLAREPRFEVKRAVRWQSTVEGIRSGRIGISMDGIYRPRGHLGDPTPEGARRINVFATGTSFILEQGQL